MKKKPNRKSWLTHQLRRLSLKWPPRNNLKKNNRREYYKIRKDGTKFKKPNYEYQCNSCEKWFPDSKIQVDHVIPIMNSNTETFTEEQFYSHFILGLFCYEDNLQLLCEECHNIKTETEKKS